MISASWNHRPFSSSPRITMAAVLAATWVAAALVGCGDDDTSTSGGGAGGGAGQGGAVGQGGDPAGSGGDGGAGASGGAAPWAPPACAPIATLAGAPIHTTIEGHRAIVPLDEPNVLLATRSVGLDRSADAGCTWETIAERIVDSVAARPGGGAIALSGSAAGATLFSIDGPTVTELGAAPEAAGGCCRASRVIADPSDRDRLLLTSSGETLWRSLDGGASWSEQVLPTLGEYPGVREISVDPRGLDRFVFSDWDYVWSTEDAGVSFTIATFEADGVTFEDVYASSLLRSPASPDVVLAQVIGLPDGTGAPGGVYRSEDGGRTFLQSPWPEGFVRWAADPRSPETYWAAKDRVPSEGDTPPSGTVLIHVDGEVEDDRVELAPATTVMTFSPAQALHVGLYAPY